MTDSTTVDVTDDLDAFSEEFFGTAKIDTKAEAPDDNPEDVEVPETPSATDTVDNDGDEEESKDEKSDQEDAPAADDEDPEDEDDKPVSKPKGRKSARERINELTAKAHQAERELLELRRRLEGREEVKPEVKPNSTPTDGPDPDALAADGNPVYPLGEFDPNYISDLTRFVFKQESEAQKKADEEDRAKIEQQNAEQELLTSWTEKAKGALERIPDLPEKVIDLEDTFSGLDPGYGQFLASTIMSMDFGPDVLNYLADNVVEAQKIVAAGPTKATIALGRIEARFFADTEKKSDEVEKGTIVPTKAPPPPPKNRGSGSSTTVPDDTDDLDAFEKKFYT